MRAGTWNVGSMTRKGDVFKRRKRNITCVQETKWGGNSTIELGDSYKIFYSGETNARNGVGAILYENLKKQVFEVQRPSDRLIRGRLVIGGRTYSVISAYAPQSGRSDEGKDEFFRNLEDLINMVPARERLVVGANLNGHVGRSSDGFQRVHGGKDSVIEMQR